MIEKQILMLLKGIREVCKKHYPCCDDCKFCSETYYGCKYRDFTSLIDCSPKNLQMRLAELMLNEQADD